MSLLNFTSTAFEVVLVPISHYYLVVQELPRLIEKAEWSNGRIDTPGTLKAIHENNWAMLRSVWLCCEVEFRLMWIKRARWVVLVGGTSALFIGGFIAAAGFGLAHHDLATVDGTKLDLSDAFKEIGIIVVLTPFIASVGLIWRIRAALALLAKAGQLKIKP